MTSDAEPLSDEAFAKMVDTFLPLYEPWEMQALVFHDARYHRARVRELQRQVEAARAALEQIRDQGIVEIKLGVVGHPESVNFCGHVQYLEDPRRIAAAALAPQPARTEGPSDERC